MNVRLGAIFLVAILFGNAVILFAGTRLQRHHIARAGLSKPGSLSIPFAIDQRSILELSCRRRQSLSY